jgi:protein arginine kinase activator
LSERCDFCNGPATWQFTEVVGGRRHTVHVCATCAQARGIVGAKPSVAAPEPKSSPIVSISFEVTSPTQLPAVPTAPRRCTHCGTTLVAIRKSGRVGCPHCYSVFRRHLEPLLRRVHGSLDHHGSRPDGGAVEQVADRREELDRLRQELRQAIEAEDFENAARLRDAIAQWRDPAPRERP